MTKKLATATVTATLLLVGASQPARTAGDPTPVDPAALVGVFHGWWSPYGLESEVRIFAATPDQGVSGEYLTGSMKSPWSINFKAKFHGHSFGWTYAGPRGDEHFSFTLMADGKLHGEYVWGSSTENTVTMTKTGEPAWPHFQDRFPIANPVADFESPQSLKAALPADVTISPPAVSAPAALAKLSGVWSGWLCNGRTTDMKLAVTSVSETGVEDVLALSRGKNGPALRHQFLKLVGGEFLYEAPDFSYRYRFHPGTGNVLDVMFTRSNGYWCSGLLHKDGSR